MERSLMTQSGGSPPSIDSVRKVHSPFFRRAKTDFGMPRYTCRAAGCALDALRPRARRVWREGSSEHWLLACLLRRSPGGGLTGAPITLRRAQWASILVAVRVGNRGGIVGRSYGARRAKYSA